MFTWSRSSCLFWPNSSADHHVLGATPSRTLVKYLLSLESIVIYTEYAQPSFRAWASVSWERTRHRPSGGIITAVWLRILVYPCYFL